jgi:hypothetical protein
MENNITLESLIQEHKERLSYLRDVGNIFSYYEYDDMDSYQLWIEKTKRYMRQNFPGDPAIKDFEVLATKDIEPEQQKRLLAIVKALSLLPKTTPVAQTNIKNTLKQDSLVININNTNSQSQSQEQSMSVQLFTEAIKNELTSNQIKELKAIVAEADNDFQKARPSIVAKLKEFGTDVASNIIANILTNPII